jgi:hypothetical protein
VKPGTVDRSLLHRAGSPVAGVLMLSMATAFTFAVAARVLSPALSRAARSSAAPDLPVPVAFDVLYRIFGAVVERLPACLPLHVDPDGAVMLWATAGALLPFLVAGGRMLGERRHRLRQLRSELAVLVELARGRHRPSEVSREARAFLAERGVQAGPHRAPTRRQEADDFAAVEAAAAAFLKQR